MSLLMDSPTLPCLACREDLPRKLFLPTPGTNKGRGERRTKCNDCFNERARELHRLRRAKKMEEGWDGTSAEVKVWPPIIGGMDPQRIVQAGVKEWTFFQGCEE